MKLIIDFPGFSKVPSSFDVAGDVLVGEDEDGLVKDTICHNHLSLDPLFCAEGVSLRR